MASREQQIVCVMITCPVTLTPSEDSLPSAADSAPLLRLLIITNTSNQHSRQHQVTLSAHYSTHYRLHYYHCTALLKFVTADSWQTKKERKKKAQLTNQSISYGR